MNASTYTPNQLSEALKKWILANDKLISRGKNPIAYSVCGEAGIGKSTVEEETVSGLGRPFKKVSLSQYTEPCELIGYYAKEFLLTKVDKQTWVTENLIPTFIENGYEYTGETRTKPCPPDWVYDLQEGTIICLDDFTRGNQLMCQAVMELVHKREMIGWDLVGKKIQIILNENPQDGEYNVTSQDKAQNTRKGNAIMVWCHKSWAERAERLGRDGRLINFVLWKPEHYENKKQDGISSSGTVTPRQLDMFFDLIETIEGDFENHLDQIAEFGNATVGKDVVNDFTNFVKKKLDKLPTVDDLIRVDSLETAKKKLTTVCGIETQSTGKNAWNHATVAIMSIRFLNYAKFNSQSLTEANIIQYRELALHNSFGNDHKYLMLTNVLADLGDLSSLFFEDSRYNDLVME
jgi:dynein-related subfamily AAA family protein